MRARAGSGRLLLRVRSDRAYRFSSCGWLQHKRVSMRKSLLWAWRFHLVNGVDLPQRAERRVAAAVLGGARRPACGRYLLVPPVEESKAGDLNGDRWIQVAALAQSRGVDEGGEGSPGVAVGHAVPVRRDLDDDARCDRARCRLGQLHVRVSVRFVQFDSASPSADYEHAVLAARARGAYVFAREAPGRPARQDRGDLHPRRGPGRERGVDLLAPPIVWLGAGLGRARSWGDEQPTRDNGDDWTQHLGRCKECKVGAKDVAIDSATETWGVYSSMASSRPDPAECVNTAMHPVRVEP